MIILIGSEKGGTGKSTTSQNLIYWLSSKCKSVLAVDADSQGTLTKWCDNRDDAGFSYIPCVQKTGRITNALKEMDRKYDYTICDIGGRDSPEFRSALVVADICLCPFKASAVDMQTLEKMDDVINVATDLNQKLKVFSYLNMCSTNPKVHNETQLLIKSFEEYPALNIMKSNLVSDRKVFRDVFEPGMSVFEETNSKAIGEIGSLFEAMSII